MKFSSTLKIAGMATLAAAAMGLSSCRSPLYYAAERGDIQTVERQINVRHADVNDKPSMAHLWWQLPTTLVTLPIDITLIYGSVFTLPLYVDNPFVTSEWVGSFTFLRKSPLEAALENGHLDVVEYLIANGAECTPELRKRFEKEKELQKKLDVATEQLRSSNEARAKDKKRAAQLQQELKKREEEIIMTTPD